MAGAGLDPSAALDGGGRGGRAPRYRRRHRSAHVRNTEAGGSMTATIIPFAPYARARRLRAIREFLLHRALEPFIELWVWLAILALIVIPMVTA